MKILVTGGAGFIGAHLSNRLSDLEHSVFVVDNLSNGKKDKLRHKIKFFQEDIRGKNFKVLIKQIKPYIIYHLAAQSSVSRSISNPKNDIQINLLATQDLIEEATKNRIKKIVFSSSAAIYAQQKSIPLSENSAKSPLSTYGLAKLSSEYLFQLNFKRNHIPYTCLRYSNVYGEGQDNSAEGGVVAIFVNRILNGQKVIINGDGKQTRDFIHVSDVVDANIAALNPKIEGELNVSTGTETSINNLYKLLLNISKKKSQKSYIPLSTPEIRNSILNSNKLQNTAKWTPQMDLENGLKKTYTFIQNS